jgi:PiT family inorganic phosphate transporter
MHSVLVVLIGVVIVALIFDYINGFHDAANAIATSVSTGVLPLRTAVFVAAVFDFSGALIGTAVAKTIASGFTDASVVTQPMVLAVLIGASIWNIITWWFGIPSSSSHALIGALAGAVVVHAGIHAFKWATLVKKVLVPLIMSPLLGYVIALTLMLIILRVARHMQTSVVNRVSRRMQLVSACAMAFSHGSNDAQKVMGIITLSLVAYVTSGAHPALPAVIAPIKHGEIWDVPRWVMFACAFAIASGTATGGKRIIKTMGSKIIKISPLQGFAAETAGTATILTASALGIPVSTTHCINACIMGVGSSRRLSSVRWGVAHRIVVAWVVTLPASAAFAALVFLALRAIGIAK